MNVGGLQVLKYEATLFAVVLLGIFLRVYNLGAHSLGTDDTWSVWIAPQSLLTIVQYTAADVHPPFFYIVLHYWMACLGTSELALKALPIVFGVAAIPAVYFVGRELFDARTGLLAAFILAASSFHIRYAQEVRMYSLLVLLGVLSMYFFIRLARHNTPVTWIGYVIATTLMLYTHVYGLFLLIAQNVYVVSLVLISRTDAMWWRRFATLEGVVIVLFAAWIPLFIHQADRAVQSFSVARLSPPAVAVAFRSYAGGTLLLALFLILAVLSFVTLRATDATHCAQSWRDAVRGYARRMRISDLRAQFLLVVWLVSVNAVPLMASFISSIKYVDRYTIAASVALYLLVAKGITNLHHRTAQVTVVCVIALLLSLSAGMYVTGHPTEYWGKEGWVQSRETFNVINERGQSGDVLVMYPQMLWSVNRYYDKVGGMNAALLPVTPSRTDVDTLYADAKMHDRIWFVVYTYHSPPGAMEQYALSTFNATHSVGSATSYEGYRVYLLTKRV